VGGEFLRVIVVRAGKEGGGVGLEQGQSGDHTVKARDGGVVGLEGFSAVGGGLPMLADAEGACGGVHAGVDDIRQVMLREAAVVLDQRREVLLG